MFRVVECSEVSDGLHMLVVDLARLRKQPDLRRTASITAVTNAPALLPFLFGRRNAPSALGSARRCAGVAKSTVRSMPSGQGNGEGRFCWRGSADHTHRPPGTTGAGGGPAVAASASTGQLATEERHNRSEHVSPLSDVTLDFTRRERFVYCRQD